MPAELQMLVSMAACFIVPLVAVVIVKIKLSGL